MSGRGEGSRYDTMFSGQCTEATLGRGRGFRLQEEEEEREERQLADAEEGQSLWGKRRDHRSEDEEEEKAEG